jgi:hypothetical protein
MENDIFYSDMAVDNLENRGLKDIAVVKNLSYGIRQIVVNIKNKQQAESVGKEKGLYITYDTSGANDDKTLAAFNADCEKRGCPKDKWK